MPETSALLSERHMRLKQCRHGPMLYNVNDVYLGRSLDLYGEYTEDENRFFSATLGPGSSAVDVGAHIGCHTVFMAKRVGPEGAVFAFEPQRVIFQNLCANLALNGLSNVRVFNAAAGSEEGAITVPDIDYGAEGNFGGVSLGGDDGEQVPLTTIDGLGLPACHLIKADVEGMEADVIRGATETIKTHWPVLYVENDRREKSPDLIELLLGLDYRLYWHLVSLFNGDNFFGQKNNVFGDIVSLNMIGIPKSRDQNMTGVTEITGPQDWPNEPASGAGGA
ncbi:MAG: FkbM family methyltransferase [Proteobacteria bacterium]|nr:FkbM family methyltransferase [Pseudomonadota bacterium]